MAGSRLISKATRLVLVLFLANALLVLAAYVALFVHHRSITTVRTPPPEWIAVFRYGVVAGQLLVLAVVGSLVDRPRCAVWLLAMPLSVLLLTLGVLPDDERDWMRLLWVLTDRFENVRYWSGQLLVILYINMIAHLFITVSAMLFSSVVMWPLRVFLGWRLHWSDDTSAHLHQASIWQLMLWVGLWAAVCLLYVQARDAYGTDWLIPALIAVPVALVAGLPIFLLCSRPRISWYWWPILAAYVVLLSYGESELTFFLATLTAPAGVGIPVAPTVCFNATLAGVVALNSLIMRAFGLTLALPIPLSPAQGGDRTKSFGRSRASATSESSATP